MKVKVINLDRTPERLTRFVERNPGIEIERVSACDGKAMPREAFVDLGLITVDNLYNAGALGCAMSHAQLWQQCAAGSEPFHIAEDDVLLRGDFADVAEGLLGQLGDWDIVLWSYNLDWPALVEFAPGQGRALVQFDEASVIARSFRAGRRSPLLVPLISATGTACYSISPKGARRALANCLPIGNAPAVYFREPVNWENQGIDVELCRHYARWRSYLALPFLAYTENDKLNSSIRGIFEAIPEPEAANPSVSLLDIGLVKRIRNTWRPAVPLTSTDIPALNNAALDLQTAGRHQEAIEYYERALALWPSSRELHYNKGNALSDLGRYEEALQAFDTALAIEGDDVATLINRSVALDRLARFEEALAGLDKALALSPEHDELRENRNRLAQLLADGVLEPAKPAP